MNLKVPLPLLITGVVMSIATLVLGVAIARSNERSASTPTSSPRHFSLTTHTGEHVTEATYRGKLLLVYFGYTFCPDVCPTELGYQARVMRALGASADSIVPLFITIDPSRDTKEHLAEYVPLFNPRLIGLTGTEDDIAAAAKSFGAFYQRARVEGGPKDYYLMDHSSTSYLLDREGRQIGTLDAHDPIQQSVSIIQAAIIH